MTASFVPSGSSFPLKAALIFGVAMMGLATAGPASADLNSDFPTTRTSVGLVSDKGQYTVADGDTLYGIASRFKVSVTSIKDLNALTSNAIGSGKKLFIPGLKLGNSPSVASTLSVRAPSALGSATSGNYQVKSGDTLYRIAVANNISVRELVNANQLGKGDVIYVGQSIVLPSKSDQRQLALRSTSTPRALNLDSNTATPLPKRGTLQQARISGALSDGAFGADRPRGTIGQALGIPTPFAKPGSETEVAAVETASDSPVPAPLPTAVKANANLAGTDLLWPLRGQLLDTFGLKKDGVKVDGITIAAKKGSPIVAADKGTVMYSGDALSDFGQLLLIKHENGLITAYAHNDKILVKKGEDVDAGAVVARAGQSGDAGQPQLHFQVRKNGKPVDPLQFLSR